MSVMEPNTIEPGYHKRWLVGAAKEIFSDPLGFLFLLSFPVSLDLMRDFIGGDKLTKSIYLTSSIIIVPSIFYASCLSSLLGKKVSESIWFSLIVASKWCFTIGLLIFFPVCALFYFLTDGEPVHKVNVATTILWFYIPSFVFGTYPISPFTVVIFDIGWYTISFRRKNPEFLKGSIPIWICLVVFGIFTVSFIVSQVLLVYLIYFIREAFTEVNGTGPKKEEKEKALRSLAIGKA